jgi:hypothetical protein
MAQRRFGACHDAVITGFDTVDVRFPTSLSLDGSDAMNLAPDYPAVRDAA